MVRLAERSCMYLAGLSVLGVGLILFTIGFATPNWVEQRYVSGSRFGIINAKNTYGLWQVCSSSLGLSICLNFGATNAAYNAVRALECITLIFFIGFGIVAFVHNFTSATNRNVVAINRFLTILAILGGILGIIGAIVFAVTSNAVHLSWSFGLVITGCVLAIIGSILMTCFPGSQFTTSAGNNGVVFQTTQYPMGVQQPHVQIISTTNQYGQHPANQYGQPPARAQSYVIA